VVSEDANWLNAYSLGVTQKGDPCRVSDKLLRKSHLRDAFSFKLDNAFPPACLNPLTWSRLRKAAIILGTSGETILGPERPGRLFCHLPHDHFDRTGMGHGADPDHRPRLANSSFADWHSAEVLPSTTPPR
jgi:hypothetical protein